jgi:hypothetical protein
MTVSEVETDQKHRDCYHLLTEACDRLLTHPQAHWSWLAVPFLHVISGHPTMQRQYRGLTAEDTPRTWRERWVGMMLAHGRNVLPGAVAPHKVAFGRRDVLLVGGLVDAAHLDHPADFYYGDLQRGLAARGIRSVLLLRNQTGLPTAALRHRAWRDGVSARALLPDALRWHEERTLVREAFEGRNVMRALGEANETPWQRAVRAACRPQIASPSTTGNLRLERQIEALCRLTRPRVVLTLYEGHAWERCVWRGARRADATILCAGYQHTIMRESAHAMRRSLGGHADPDLLLCMGEITREELTRTPGLGGKELLVLGTHRRAEVGVEPAMPARRSVCLVLPEGMEDETVFLFGFALEAAVRLPAIRFVLRTHPLISAASVVTRLVGAGRVPPNVEVAEEQPFGADIGRAGTMLYRGSSTVVYGILAGLKPFYVQRPGELTLDPLYRLETWRERVRDPADFATALLAHEAHSDDARQRSWSAARDFCRAYAMAEQPAAIDRLAVLSRA